MTRGTSGAILVLACALLSACVTAEERAVKKASEERTAQATREQHCGMFGYKAGTPDYSKCLENLYVQDQQKAAYEDAQRSARLQVAGASLQQAGAAMSAIGQSAPSAPAPMLRPPVRCNTIGSTTTCQ